MQVTRDALAAAAFDPAEAAQLVFGTTIPQPNSFFTLLRFNQYQSALCVTTAHCRSAT